MTLILCCLTPEAVHIAVERRLSVNYKAISDEADKLLTVCDSAAFAFTGIADLVGAPTETWMRVILGNERVTNGVAAIRALAAAAPDALARTTAKEREKRLALVGVGWDRFDGELQPTPRLFLATNMLDHRLQPTASISSLLEPRFIKPMDREQLCIFSFGWPLSRALGQRLERDIRKMLEHGVGPENVRQAMADTVREVSRSHSNVVGPDTIAVTAPLPRHSLVTPVRRAPMIVGAPANLEMPTFMYYPAQPNTPPWRGPAFVCGDAGMGPIRIVPAGQNLSGREWQRVMRDVQAANRLNKSS